MPIIVYACEDGHRIKKFFRKSPEKGAALECPACGKTLHRQLSAPNAASVVTIDNGVQSKAVEVNLELVEKIREQSTQDFTQKD